MLLLLAKPSRVTTPSTCPVLYAINMCRTNLFLKELLTVCWNDGKPYESIYSVQAKSEILNPTVESLYPVLENIFAEFKQLFPDEYIHLGNDEVYYECWKSNPNISEWMKTMNYTSYHELEAYYSKRLLQITKDLGKKVTVWQDVFDNGVEVLIKAY
jgi:hexosaminidase